MALQTMLTTTIGQITTGSALNPLLSFGPALEFAAAEKNSRKRRFGSVVSPLLSYGRGFTPSEARRRVPEIVSGEFIATSLQELSDYLGKRLMAIEAMTFSGVNKGIAYLRDMISGISVPASLVHGFFRKANLDRLTGFDTSRPASQFTATEMRYRDAIRVAYGGQKPNYRGWDGLKTGLPIALSRKELLAYTVVNGEGYIGRPGKNMHDPLECDATPQKTMRLLYGYLVKIAESKGRSAPDVKKFEAMSEENRTAFLNRYFVFNEDMTPGTPILLRDSGLVKADIVHHDLAANVLEERFGQTFSEFWAKLHHPRTRDDLAFDNVPSPVPENHVEATAPQHRARKHSRKNQGAKDRDAIIIVSDTPDSPTRIMKFDEASEGFIPLNVNSLNGLPPGTYTHFFHDDEITHPSGYVFIDRSGNASFLDLDNNQYKFERSNSADPPTSFGVVEGGTKRDHVDVADKRPEDVRRRRNWREGVDYHSEPENKPEPAENHNDDTGDDSATYRLAPKPPKDS